MSLWFHLLSLFRVGLDDFHFRALLALISEGKSDQNEKCNFAKEGVLRSKNWRKQTHLKIQFYIDKHVWQKALGGLSDIVVFSPNPNGHHKWTSVQMFTLLCTQKDFNLARFECFNLQRSFISCGLFVQSKDNVSFQNWPWSAI